MIPVEFINPRRPRRSMCDGFFVKEEKMSDGTSRMLIHVDLPSPANLLGYKVWVKSENVFFNRGFEKPN